MNTPASPEQPITPVRLKEPSVWEIYFPQHVTGHRDCVYVASFPPMVYFWPTIAWFFLAALFQGAFGLSPHAIGWISVLIMTFNLIVFVQDFDQKQFVILVLVVLALVLFVWIMQLYGMTFLSSIASWIAGFSPIFATNTYMILGIIMLALWTWGCITPLFQYWRLEQNEFVHYTQPIGRDMSIPRLGCTVYKEVPDIFESILLGGGGSLVFRKEQQVVATIPHIPFLSVRMKHIEHMLSETRVIVEKE